MRHDNYFQSGISDRPSRWRSWALCAAVAVAASTWAWAALPIWGQSAEPLASTSRVRNTDRNSRDGADKARYREGTAIVDLVASIEIEGDAASIIGNDGVRFGGLPNLNLERIVRTLKTVSEPNRVQWSISGVATEYGGRNYLLISRAVYKATSAATAE